MGILLNRRLRASLIPSNMEGLHAEEGSVGGNYSRALSQGQMRLESERRREQQCMQEGHQTRLDSDKGSSQGERIVSYILEQSYCSKRDQELENLRKQVKELEIELRGRRRRRDREGSSDDPNYTGGGTRESSHYSGLRRSRDRSHKTIGCHHDSPYQDTRDRALGRGRGGQGDFTSIRWGRRLVYLRGALSLENDGGCQIVHVDHQHPLSLSLALRLLQLI
nr:hypothetical protein CFP56_55215 [Quercus suber]